MKKEKEIEHVELSLLLTYFHIGLLSLFKAATRGLFTWSGGPRSSVVGFLCFHALEDTRVILLTRETDTYN